jgi:hypothetical protein
MAHTGAPVYGGDGAAGCSRVRRVFAGLRIFAPHDLYLGESDQLTEKLGLVRGAVGFVVLLAAGHPLLPPLVAPLATALYAAQPLVFDPRDTGGMPAVLHLALILGGPLTIGTLSYLEIVRLRRNQLFPFRDGPPRERPGYR